jgi:hypothetical protein
MTELMKIGVLKPDDNSKREVAAHRNETKKLLPLNVFTDDIDQACELVVTALWQPSVVTSTEKPEVMKMIRNSFSIHGSSVGNEWMTHAEDAGVKFLRSGVRIFYCNCY